MRAAPLASLLLLALPACPSRSAPPAAPTPPRPAPVAPPAPSPAPAPAPSAPPAPAPAPAPAATTCTARPLQAFHLRPTDAAESAGPELPAGTELEVLDLGRARRRRQQLLRVRVRSTGAEGFTFASNAELGAGCPATWPAELSERATEQRPTSPTRDAALLSALRTAFFVGERFTEAPQGEALGSRVAMDLDGDGTQDEFLEVRTDSDNFPAVTVALLHPARGWVGYVLAVTVDTDHPNLTNFVTVSEPQRLGDAVYLPRSAGELATDDQSNNTTDQASHSLLRCRVGGPCPAVFAGRSVFGSEENWSYAAEGNLLRVSNGLGRSQLLRWDPARWELVRQ